MYAPLCIYVELLLLISITVPSYAQGNWRMTADSALQDHKMGRLASAQALAVRAAGQATPAAPTDSLWQVAVKLSRPLPDSVEVATLLRAGKFFFSQNALDKAQSYLAECRKQAERLHLPVYYLPCYAVQAQIASRRKEYGVAQRLYKAIAADSFALKQTTWRVTGLVGVAEITSARYEFDSAEVVVRQAFDLLAQLPDRAKSRDYPMALLLSARFYYMKDSLNLAMQQIEEAYTLANTHFPDDPVLISIGFLYAHIYGDINDEKALKATNNAQRVLQKQVDYQRHPYYLKLSANQIGLLDVLNRPKEAAQVADSVLNRQSLDDFCLLYGFDQFLSRALRTYLATGQVVKAETIARKARQLLAEKGNGGANPSFLNAILGRYSHYNRQWADAVRYYTEEIRLDSVDQGVSYLNHGLTNRLAICQAAAGQRQAALTTFSFMTNQFADNVRRNLWVMNEPERLNFLSTTTLPGLFWFMLQGSDPQPAELGLVYNYKLLSRGAALQTGRLINEVMHEQSRVDSSALLMLINVQSQQTSQRSQLTNQVRQRLTLTADSLQHILGNVAQLIKQANKSVNWQLVQARLKPDEVAVEIIRYDNFLLNYSRADSTRYAALVLRPGWASPRLVPLPMMTNRETRLLASYTGIEQQSDDHGEAYAAMWQPLAAAIGTVKRVYVAVDGIYQMVSLPTLFNTKTKKYLLDETELVVLNSTQSLLDTPPLAKPVSAELMGNPAYYLQYAGMPKQTPNPVASRRIMLRNGVPIKELPFTKIEVEQLDRQLRQHGIRSVVCTGPDATETAAFQWRSPSVVHFATHGFAQDSSTKAKAIGLAGCGLALAGAADTAHVNAHDDGILTGYEASLLNLHKTQLVVLSACQTGAGDYIEGEGIFGLQRGFMLAGSKAVLMSLWEVGDQVTQQFMTTFYQHWLSGLSKPAALRQTQYQLRRRYPQVQAWGSFVLMGI